MTSRSSTVAAGALLLIAIGLGVWLSASGHATSDPSSGASIGAPSDPSSRGRSAAPSPSDPHELSPNGGAGAVTRSASAVPDRSREIDQAIVDSEREDKATAARVIDELNGLFEASAMHGVTAHVEADEVVIEAPNARCDHAMLAELRDTLASFQIDAGRTFRAMRCTSGTKVTFK